VKRPNTTTIDPAWLSSGSIGAQTAIYDEAQRNGDDVLRIVLDDFVNLLPEWQRSAVQMTVMANMTYREASEIISTLRGIPTDRKTVWRWSKSGVEQIMEWMRKSPWVGAITRNKIPVEYLDKITEATLPSPWREDASS